MPTPLPPIGGTLRSPPPGFRQEDMVINAIPDTPEMIERSFNPKAKLAFDELLKLRGRPQAGS